MIVLVLNSGSSSLRFQVIETDLDLIERDQDRVLARGMLERIGSHALISLQASGRPAVKQDAPLRDHRAAIDAVLRWIISAVRSCDLRCRDIRSGRAPRGAWWGDVKEVSEYRRRCSFGHRVVPRYRAPSQPLESEGIRAHGAPGGGVSRWRASTAAFLRRCGILLPVWNPLQLYRRHNVRDRINGTSHGGGHVAYDTFR